MSIPIKETIDFATLLGHVKESRNFLNRATRLMAGKERQQFQNLLSLIDANIVEAEVAVPECMNAFKSKFEELCSQHHKNKAEVAQLEKQLAEIKAQTEAKKKAPPAVPPVAPVDLNLGQDLRNDLLKRFLPKPEKRQTESEAAWQDWSIDDNWLPESFDDL